MGAEVSTIDSVSVVFFSLYRSFFLFFFPSFFFAPLFPCFFLRSFLMLSQCFGLCLSASSGFAASWVWIEKGEGGKAANYGHKYRAKKIA